jgi:hypothetical protein
MWFYQSIAHGAVIVDYRISTASAHTSFFRSDMAYKAVIFNSAENQKWAQLQPERESFLISSLFSIVLSGQIQS